jgi:GlpG protein
MRLIGELDDTQQARCFAAFLLIQGIETHVDQEDGKAEIWVKDEDRFPEATNELAAFKENPNDAKYSGSLQQAKTLIREEEKKRQQIQKKIVNVSGGILPRRRPLTFILIAACVLVGLLTGFGENAGTERGVAFDAPIYQALQFVSLSPPASEQVAREAKSPDDLALRLASIRRGQIWRLFTTIFIHYGIIHLLFNMIWFFQFGTVIEHRYGTLKFALLVLVTAAISSLFQCGVPVAVGGSSPFFPKDSDVLITASGGMSGVLYGLFGFIWMKSTYDPKFGYRLSQSTVIILIGWLLFCMIPPQMRSGIFDGNVGNWAHGIGLLVGMAIGYGTSMTRS